MGGTLSLFTAQTIAGRTFQIFNKIFSTTGPGFLYSRYILRGKKRSGWTYMPTPDLIIAFYLW